MGFNAKLFDIIVYPESFDTSKLEEILQHSRIKDYAYILHNKDDKKEHIHIDIRTKDSCNSDDVAKWFGILPNAVGRVKGRWSDVLKYLIHANAKDKFQYDSSEVISNFDWQKAIQKGNDDNRLDVIIGEIATGIIREYNYTNYITDKEYIRYKRQIDTAFNYRVDKMKGVAREMNAIFITGDSGTGKTTYAKQIASEKGYSVYVSSGSNDILDDYKGQDCIVLDDLRPSSLGLADLLKMLDNHTASTVKSRYKNKVLECKLIIITTVLDIDTFFNNVFSEEKETIIQLKRRCKVHVRMDVDYIYMKMWQEKSRKYGTEFKQVNSVALNYNIKDMSEEEQLAALSEILGNTKVIVDDIKANFDEYKQCDINELDDK